VTFEYTTEVGRITFVNLHDFVRYLIDKKGLSNFETIQDLILKSMRTKKKEVPIVREDRPMKPLNESDMKKEGSLSSLRCEIHNYAAFCMKNDLFTLDTSHNISLYDILPSETEASTNPSSAKKNTNEPKIPDEMVRTRVSTNLTDTLEKVLFEKKDIDPADPPSSNQKSDTAQPEVKLEMPEAVKTPEKPVSLPAKQSGKPSNGLNAVIHNLLPGQVISRKVEHFDNHTNPKQELMKRKRGTNKNMPEPKQVEQLIAERLNKEELPVNSMSNQKPTYVSSRDKEKKRKLSKRKPEVIPPIYEHKAILERYEKVEESPKKEEEVPKESNIDWMDKMKQTAAFLNSVTLRNIN
jgi:hypothetical protein